MDSGGHGAPVVDGRFALLDKLGGGGMGLVWRAYDTALQREVALKEVRSAEAAAPADPTEAALARERVLREARALARLQHPNVVTIYHIVDTPQMAHPWLVMELVGGGSLADRLQRGPLSPAEAVRVGRGVLAALAAAHASGIQHRDVKPGNVLLRPDGTPVLTDFGIAALQGSTQLTATGSLIGSPEYMAPERLRGVEGDPASDLWSLGILLYVAVEGAHPLRRSTTMATLAAVLDAPIPEPVRAGPLAPVLRALLTRDPAARPRADQLDRMLAQLDQMPAGGASGAAPVAGSGGWSSQPGYASTGGPGAGAAPGAMPGPGGSWPPMQHSPMQQNSMQHGSMQHGSMQQNPMQHAPMPQPPSGPQQPWQQPPAPFPAPAEFWDAGTGPTPGAPAHRRSSRSRARFVVGISATAAVGLIGALVWTVYPGLGEGAQAGGAPTGHTGSPRTTAAHTGTGAAIPPTASVLPDASGPAASAGADGSGPDLLTPAGVDGLIAALKPVTGSTKVYLLDLYPTYAVIEVPSKTVSDAYDDYLYRDGTVQFDSTGGYLDSGDLLVDLTTVDWNALPGLVQKSDTELNVTDPTDHYAILDPNWPFGNGPALLVYCGNGYGDGYLLADTSGDVLKTYPAGS